MNLGRFRWWVDQICHQEGFFVNQQQVPGDPVVAAPGGDGHRGQRRLRVPRRGTPPLPGDPAQLPEARSRIAGRGQPRFADYLRGFASYLHMVHPEGAECLREINALLGPDEPGEDA